MFLATRKLRRRIRVSTIRPSQDVRPLERATFASSYFFRLRSRSSLSPPNAYAIRSSSNRAVRRLRADGPLFRRRCCGRRRRCWFLTRSSLVASLMAAVASLMATVAPRLAAVHPVGPGGLSRRGGGAAASCASASDGSSADDSVKPNAAPNPSRESALRREIISVLIFWFISGLPVAHDCRTGLAVG